MRSSGKVTRKGDARFDRLQVLLNFWLGERQNKGLTLSATHACGGRTGRGRGRLSAAAFYDTRDCRGTRQEPSSFQRAICEARLRGESVQQHILTQHALPFARLPPQKAGVHQLVVLLRLERRLGARPRHPGPHNATAWKELPTQAAGWQACCCGEEGRGGAPGGYPSAFFLRLTDLKASAVPLLSTAQCRRSPFPSSLERSTLTSCRSAARREQCSAACPPRRRCLLCVASCCFAAAEPRRRRRATTPSFMSCWVWSATRRRRT